MTEAIAVSVLKKKKENLKTLEPMLWGGSLLLMLEHIYHGELFTFDLAETLTKGLLMAVLVTVTWFIMTRYRAKILESKGIMASIGILLMILVDFSL